MDKETFASTMQLAVDYYKHDLSKEAWQFYYEELGGMTTKELEEALRKHMQTLKSFPQVSHLRPQRAVKLLQEKKDLPQHHAEFGRTYVACVNHFEHEVGLWNEKPEPADYPVNISEVVNPVVKYYRAKADELGAHTAASNCRGAMHGKLCELFGGL